MGLDDLIDKEKKKRGDKKTKSGSSSNSPEQNYKNKIESEYDEVTCPKCDSKAEETKDADWAWRCPKPLDECDVISFIHPEYTFYGNGHNDEEKEDDEMSEFLEDINLE